MHFVWHVTECLGESELNHFIFFTHVLVYCVWVLEKCSTNRILEEKNGWKFLWRHLFMYFSFLTEEKSLYILKACALRYKDLIWKTKHFSHPEEQRGKERLEHPKPCGFSLLSGSRRPARAQYSISTRGDLQQGIKEARLALQCHSRHSPLCANHWWEKGELKAIAQFISGFTSCTNISFSLYFGSIK